MVDGNENYKFDLGVKGLRYQKKIFRMQFQTLHPELFRGLYLLRIEYFQQLHLRKAEKCYFVCTDVKNIGVNTYLWKMVKLKMIK